MKTVVVSLLLIFAAASCLRAEDPTDAQLEEAKKDASFDVQGEYVGRVDNDGEQLSVGLQIIALGKGRFRGAGYVGGLPGDGWNGEERLLMEGELRTDDTVVFETEPATLVYEDGEVTVLDEGHKIGSLKKTERKSPTLGKKPPRGAVVLFDGTNADQWEKGELDGKFLQQGQMSKQKFGSHSLHVEFRTPYQPEDSGQGRGNSGLYLQGRYEVQILDSFGLKGEHNECGGIYSIKDPDVNMCFPPLVWQTYDVDFTAAEYDNSGQVVKNPTMTVRHNGVVIHDDVELPKGTTAAPIEPGPEPGPVYLQDHGNPVRFRNIWVVVPREATN